MQDTDAAMTAEQARDQKAVPRHFLFSGKRRALNAVLAMHQSEICSKQRQLCFISPTS
jgi:hypothetical protein